MSLDVSLRVDTPVKKSGTGVFVRDNGKNRELSVEEVLEKFPDADAVENFEYTSNYVFEANITHNLGEMAQEAGIYEACWRPYCLHKGWTEQSDYDKEMEFERSVVMRAKDITPALKSGYSQLIGSPDYFRQFDSPNGWGTYESFVPWVKEYLDACTEYPEAIVETDR